MFRTQMTFWHTEELERQAAQSRWSGAREQQRSESYLVSLIHLRDGVQKFTRIRRFILIPTIEKDVAKEKAEVANYRRASAKNCWNIYRRRVY